MNLEIPFWTSHHNMLVYSYLYYCEQSGIKARISTNPSISANAAVLYVDGKKCYFDYSDDTVFCGNPAVYDFYFKRSLLPSEYKGNVYPLNFHVNYSYKTLQLLAKMRLKDLMQKKSRTEVARAFDFFNKMTNLSHHAMDVRKFPLQTTDHGGRIIFHTRLWSPDNNSDPAEKERRRLQNEFRIEACRLVKKYFSNATVGLFPEAHAINIAPDLLLETRKTSKKEYFNTLSNCDIGIADDGLKDTPGWKIGEYLLFGKAVISTPLNVVAENFDDLSNFMRLSGRSSYEEIPDKIAYLLQNRNYLAMGERNRLWSEKYLHPALYISRILSIIDKNKKAFQ